MADPVVQTDPSSAFWWGDDAKESQTQSDLDVIDEIFNPGETISEKEAWELSVDENLQGSNWNPNTWLMRSELGYEGATYSDNPWVAGAAEVGEFLNPEDMTELAIDTALGLVPWGKGLKWVGRKGAAGAGRVGAIAGSVRTGTGRIVPGVVKTSTKQQDVMGRWTKELFGDAATSDLSLATIESASGQIIRDTILRNAQQTWPKGTPFKFNKQLAKAGVDDTMQRRIYKQSRDWADTGVTANPDKIASAADDLATRAAADVGEEGVETVVSKAADDAVPTKVNSPADTVVGKVGGAGSRELIEQAGGRGLGAGIREGFERAGNALVGDAVTGALTGGAGSPEEAAAAETFSTSQSLADFLGDGGGMSQPAYDENYIAELYGNAQQGFLTDLDGVITDFSQRMTENMQSQIDNIQSQLQGYLGVSEQRKQELSDNEMSTMAQFDQRLSRHAPGSSAYNAILAGRQQAAARFSQERFAILEEEDAYANAAYQQSMALSAQMSGGMFGGNMEEVAGVLRTLGITDALQQRHFGAAQLEIDEYMNDRSRGPQYEVTDMTSWYGSQADPIFAALGDSASGAQLRTLVAQALHDAETGNIKSLGALPSTIGPTLIEMEDRGDIEPGTTTSILKGLSQLNDEVFDLSHTFVGAGQAA